MSLVERWHYNRAAIRAHPDWLFVFGDNLEGRGLGGQAREARGEPNAVGIPTKRAPRRTDDAYLSDDDEFIMLHWTKAFHRINMHLMSGGTVVWPKRGVGTGMAELEKRAPGLWRHLQLFIAGMHAVDAAAGE